LAGFNTILEHLLIIW